MAVSRVVSTRVLQQLAARPQVSRSIATRTLPRNGGGGGHGGHGDHGHHPHLVFEKGPFTKRQGLILVGGGLTVGIGVVMLAFKLQLAKNK
ncbi:hypothetical protein JKP88DRAFT_23798 [Tribonema minus]|uniref:Uncharacterized protein n=1 Tax=Tribonema minus TaxID=303371 RepID=A0A836CJR8_9STRA|nr:hypothetical protein JKP88DRAFT_23798 [Tribonema minus]